MSPEQIAGFQGNVIFPCDVWRLTTRSGAISVGYTTLARALVMDGVQYRPAPIEATRTTSKTGFIADHADFSNVFDDVITERDVRGGIWAGASIEKAIVLWKSPELGRIKLVRGFAGNWSIKNNCYTVEFLSLESRLQQTIGDLTSNTDRRSSVRQFNSNIELFTIVTNVAHLPPNKMIFRVNHTEQVENYFKYGVARFTNGANAGLEMEIKSSKQVDNLTEIELQLPMLAPIAIGDTVTLYAGYTGTREMARDKFGANAVVDFQGEPDLRGLSAVLKFPE